MPPQSPEVESLVAELVKAYDLAWRSIVEEQGRIALDPSKGRRRARLRELKAMVEEHMTALDEQARVWLSESLPVIYRAGAEVAGGVLDEPFRWTTADRSALNVLAQDAFDDLLQASQGVRDSTKALVRRLARERALVGRITGETATKSAKRLERLLRTHGIHAITYSDGSKHGLAEYSSAVIRTKTAVASNLGGVNLGQRLGVQFYEVFDGTQDIACASVNGSIVTAEWAMANPVAHVNCQRSFGPRPDLTTPEEAASAEPSTTVEQRADQSASERARAQASRERANRRAKQRRASARAGR